MDVLVKNELDPIFETIGLLYLEHAKDWQGTFIKELNNLGIDGEMFFDKHFKILERYVKVFHKYKVDTPQELFFCDDMGEETFLLVITMAVENCEFLEHPEKADVMDLRSLLAYYIIDTGDRACLPDKEDLPKLPDEKAMIEFLDTTDVKSHEKWYVLDLLRKPDYWVGKLFEMIRLNLPAFEKAKNAVEKPLQKLLKRMESFEDREFLKIAEVCSSHPVIYTSLAAPLMQLVLYSRGYRGILSEYLKEYETAPDVSKEMIIRQMKALSDKSKLDILCALKTSNKYNLELAEEMGLSPSTTSHHMTVLLACGFVTVEKKDGKVYYVLHKEEIEKFISTLKTFLL